MLNVKLIVLIYIYNNNYYYSYYYIIISGTAAQRGLRPPCSRGFLITHNYAPQSVGRLLDE
jgi:hypothetical protein